MSSTESVPIRELWIYPVKSCRGISVQTADLTPTGFKFDRTWCFVDLEGQIISKCEAISARKMPVLFRISVEFEGEDHSSKKYLVLRAEGFEPVLRVPVDAAEYMDNTDIVVECVSVLHTLLSEHFSVSLRAKLELVTDFDDCGLKDSVKDGKAKTNLETPYEHLRVI